MKEVRIDKYLWSVRLYKTRSKATEACKSGQVTMNGIIQKPSSNIKAGDKIVLKKDYVKMEILVLEALEKRVGAKLVEKYMQDLTPQEVYDKRDNARRDNFEFRERGLGRPTKKERRELDVFKRKS